MSLLKKRINSRGEGPVDPKAAENPDAASRSVEPPAEISDVSQALRKFEITNLPKTNPAEVTEQIFLDLLNTRFSYPMGINQTLDDSLVAYRAPYSSKGRKLRALAVRTMIQAGLSNPIVFAVGSGERRTGNSFLAANLAVIYSQVGFRTLLLDGNRSHPSLHKIFSDAVELDNVDPIPELRDFRSLSVIKAGAADGKKTQFSLALAENLARLRQKYHVIVVDGPTHARDGEWESIAGICGNALLSVRRDKSSFARTRKLIEATQKANANILGCVLSGQ